MPEAGEDDRPRLGRIPCARRGGMGVHVADLLGRDAGVDEGLANRDGRPFARLVRVGQVRRVAARAVAAELRVDAGPAPDGVLALLEHEDARALRHHEAVAVAVERARRLLRLAADRGERPERAVPRDDHRRERRVGTSGEHRIGAILADQRERGADRIRARGAGGTGRRGGPAQAERAGSGRGGDVRERERDGERADPIGAALVVGLVRVGERLRATVGGADGRPDPPGREVEIATGVLERERRCGGRELSAAIHPARVAAREPAPRDRSPRSDRAPRARRPGTRSASRRSVPPRANPRTARRRCPSARALRDR